MTTVPCRERTFKLTLSSRLGYHAWCYLSWFKHVLERLGREPTLALWTTALHDYDDDLLVQILSTGWQRVEANEAKTVGEELSDIAAELFSTPVEGVPAGQARALLEGTPPFPQIQQRFVDLNVQRDATAYEVLHLFHDAQALLIETLIERYGKQGELIAYDALLDLYPQSPTPQTSVEEYLSRRAARFTSPPQEPDIFAAGLEVEFIRASDTEVVTRVTECEWARYYRERHPRVGYMLACSLDNAAYRSVNGRLRLQRTSTLMEGGKACDFRVYALAHTSNSEGMADDD